LYNSAVVTGPVVRARGFPRETERVLDARNGTVRHHSLLDTRPPLSDDENLRIAIRFRAEYSAQP
jgi:hypothetical protein